MPHKPRILIVDDEPSLRRILQAAFERSGYVASTVEDGVQALASLAREIPDVVLTDVTMPGMSGHELLRRIKAEHPGLPVVVLTAFGTIPQAVQAIRDGAFEYLTKPFDLDHLKKVVSAARSHREEAKPTKTEGAKLGKRKSDRPIIAESPAMKEVLETVEQVADSRATVLVTGESGVGKEVVARALHALSTRSANPFVAVSCAALPETLLESELFGYEKGAFTGAQGAKMGRFEAANGGTLFLDEIGDVPLPVQVKLLRVLQEREFERLGATSPTRVDVRLVTATNADLQQAVDRGAFRLDLMYRLQVVEIRIPALRERPEDIVPLARHFLARFASENGREPLVLDSPSIAALEAYPWPGNVRELENTIERATVLAKPDEEELAPRLLPATLRAAA